MPITTGGTTSVNTGTPAQTGGMWAVAYGLMIITGGAPSKGGATSQSGSTYITTGTPSATGGRFPVIVYGAISVVPSAGERK